MKLIIDGQFGENWDSMLALDQFASDGESEVAGVTTVSGNVLQQVALVQAYLRQKEMDLPVHGGWQYPLKGDYESLDVNADLALSQHVELSEGLLLEGAVDFIFNTAEDLGSCRLITLGPLTNVAVAISEFPMLEEYLVEIASFVSDESLSADLAAAGVLSRAAIPWTLIKADASAKLGKGPEEPFFKAVEKAAPLPLTAAVQAWLADDLSFEAVRFSVGRTGFSHQSDANSADRFAQAPGMVVNF